MHKLPLYQQGGICVYILPKNEDPEEIFYATLFKNEDSGEVFMSFYTRTKTRKRFYKMAYYNQDHGEHYKNTFVIYIRQLQQRTDNL